MQKRKWKPCPFCGCTKLHLICRGMEVATPKERCLVWCENCGAKAEQDFWNLRRRPRKKE